VVGVVLRGGFGFALGVGVVAFVVGVATVAGVVAGMVEVLG